jgi:hypothetical protein
MKLVQTGLLLSAALWMSIGCGSSSKGSEESPDEEADLPANFTVFPAKLWSGFDGTNTYKSPVIAVVNSGNVTWTIDDPSLASIDTQSKDPVAKGDGTEIVLTSLKAGTTKIHAKDSAGHTSEATITINTYPVAQFDAGKARYMKGPNMKNPACNECHAKGKGPDHTPTELDADTDEEIQNTFTKGVDPENRPVDYEKMFTKLLNGYDHMWEVTPDEKVGLIAYLRALPPLAFPEYDAPTTEK